MMLLLLFGSFFLLLALGVPILFSWVCPPVFTMWSAAIP